MRGWRQWATVLNLQLLLHPGFGHPKILLVGLEPPLIRVFERRRKRGHDFAAVTQVTANLRPLLCLANRFEATASFDCFFELVQVQGTLVNAGESVEVGAMLLVKFG